MRQPLVAAAKEGNFKIVHRLLQAGAKPDMESPRLYPTALEAAAGAGSLDVVALLMANYRDEGLLVVDCAQSSYKARDKHQHFVARYVEQHLVALTERLGRGALKANGVGLLYLERKVRPEIWNQINSVFA